MIVRTLTEGLPAEVGLYPVGDDAVVEMLEPRGEKRHANIRSVWPDATTMETGFTSGPILAFRIEDATADLKTGAIYDRKGALLREAFGTNTIARHYAERSSPPPVSNIHRLTEPIIPIATTRTLNYCRWWLDSMGKLFVIERSRIAADRPTPMIHGVSKRFQREALALLDDVRITKGTAPRFVHGTIVASPGLTFGGGQNIGAMVSGFGQHLHRCMQTDTTAARGCGKRVYISRRRALIRRVANEPALAAALADEGFVTIELEALLLQRQAAIFAEAAIIVAPHGAGLTNLLWAHPGTMLIEIFPEGGVHGSAFLRIASQMGMTYCAIVAPAGRNDDRRGNPNNADIELDIVPTMHFICTMLAEHGTAEVAYTRVA